MAWDEFEHGGEFRGGFRGVAAVEQSGVDRPEPPVVRAI
jgi:hypothetical protein